MFVSATSFIIIVVIAFVAMARGLQFDSAGARARAAEAVSIRIAPFEVS